jgi:transcriptional regulator with XRE-family HTH domain
MIVMNDFSYINWGSLSDSGILAQIGHFIQKKRISQNITQSDLAKQAGISRSTLSLLERGETVTLATFIQVLRVLNQLQVLDAFVVREPLSPIALLKQQKKERKRARNKANTTPKETDW